MAQLAPDSVDVTDLQFKLQSKIKLFNAHENIDLNCHNLLATASANGLIFSGSTGADLRAIQLGTLADGPKQSNPVPTRIVPLPSKAFQIAVNCDDSLLAVDVMKNGVCYIQIYSVVSFYENDVRLTHEFGIPGSCRTSQLLWNPVINSVLAIVTENGGFIIATLQSYPEAECVALDGQQTVQSACWSPKGKQIVAGFPNGNLIQFKPDLKPARSIPCPNNLLGGTAFDTIAIQWLATYQFAAVFQSKTEDTTPVLCIVNAPKTETPRYINYDDICYSQAGPRKSQVFLTHILPWNLLIVASANSMEVGLLGTMEQGDFPTWKQFVPADNARAELPLTPSKQETFPLGMALEVGVTHQITIGETVYPVMPMIHLLSTDGLLISFNLLNTMPNVPGICAPPYPLKHTEGLAYFKVPEMTSTPAVTVQKTTPVASSKPETSFATSTPTQAGPKSLFGTVGEPPKAATNLFGAPPTSQVALVPPERPSGMSLEDPHLSSVTRSGQYTTFASNENPVIPLINLKIPYEHLPPPVIKPLDVKTPITLSDQSEDTTIVQAMINEEIQNFQKEINALISRSSATKINIGTKEESVSMAKQLNELSKLNKEATEVNKSLTYDVHNLRLSLNETFAMVTEAKNKHKLYKNQNHLQIQDQYSMSQTSKRQLTRLETMLKWNESNLYQVIRQLDAQWADYEDSLKQKRTNMMKIPCLEGVHQTITKEQDILLRYRGVLNGIKAKLGMRDTVKVLEITKQDPIESLTDSILSMSIIDQVQRENERLNARKLEVLKECLKRHQPKIVKPSRPDRLGIKSEVVQERREQVKKMIDKKKSEKKVEKVVKTQEKSFVAPTPVPQKELPVFLKPPKPEPKTESTEKTVKPLIPTTKPSIPTTTTTFMAPTSVPMSKPIPQKPTTTGFSFGTASNTDQTDQTPKFSFAQLTPQTTPFGGLPKSGATIPFSSASLKLGGTEEKPAELAKPVFETLSLSKPTQPTTGFSFGSGLTLTKPAETKNDTPLLFGTTSITPVVTKPSVPATVEEKSVTETKPTISFSLGGSGGLFGSTTTPSTTSFFGGFGTKQENKASIETKEEKTVELPKSPLASLVETVNKTVPSSSVVAEKPAAVSFALPKESSEKEKSPEKPQIIKPSAQFSFGFGGAQSDTPSSQPTFAVTQSKGVESTPTLSVASTASTDEKSPTDFSFSSAVLSLGKTNENVSSAATTTPATAPSMFSSISALSTSKPVTSSLFGNSGTGLFGSVSTEAAVSTSNTVTTPPTTTAPSAEGLFSSFNICSPASPASNNATTTPQSASNIFGASTGFGTGATTSSIFGGGSATGDTKPSIFGTTQPATTTASPFATSTMPKPDQSVFGNANSNTTSIFGASNTSTTSPFGQPAQSPGSIFGGGATNTGATSTFGSGSTSLFGQKPPETQSSPFGQAQQTSAFSQGGSLFGGNSTFGSGATTTGTSGFGFGQQSAQQPVFGGGATFGSPPAFGSAFSKPSFGGAPTFGQKPIFGSPTQTATQGTTAPTNNLFEQLGSQNAGMTFGNLAQNSPPQQQQQQPLQQAPPSFGGSAFSSWR